MKKARRRERKKLHQEAVALQLEEGPSELQKEDPQVRQITPGSLSPPPALSTGSPETRRPDSLDMEEQEEYLFQRTGESLEPAPARLRHSFLYSDRPRRFKRPTSIEEHVGEVSTREFEALTLDQSPPTPDSTHRIEKHDSKLEAHTMHQSPPTLHSTPSIEDYASEVRALKLARSPSTLDSTHSETGAGIVEEKPQNESVPRAQRYIYFDFVELLIAHAHGFSDPVQHKLDAEAYWAAGEKIEAPKVSESLTSLTEKLEQGKSSTEEIIENGKKWMGEEVMLAFEEYIEGKTQFKDVSYCLGEIQQQCFSVESYNHIFHHFNFTVKMKKSSETQWSSKLYFAEVKEVYGRKYYSCYELDSYDDGHCYACKNQGMHALQHPICEIGYRGGNAAMGAPFVYISDDDW